MARLTHIWKTGVVVTALLATVVACGSSDSSRARNAALVAGTSCTQPGAVTKISKVSVVCAKTTTGKIWYPTMKSYGRSVSCMKPGDMRKKKSVVWVCGVVKSKKLWLATSPLPPAVLQASVVIAPGVVEPVPVLESTDVATPSRPVVADNNVLANPTIADEAPVTTPVTIQTIPSAPVTTAPVVSVPVTTAPVVTVTAISTGSWHTCALLSSGAVKCWGYNSDGQLGLGDTNSRGDEPNEMGVNLLAVDLGLAAGVTVTAISTDSDHTCALLSSGAVKCWGSNSDGQLGLGDTNNRGDEPNEMGAALPISYQFQIAQTITFSAPIDRVFSATPFTATATSDSSLLVTLTSSTASVCTVSGFQVTMLTAGLCTLTASQVGNSTYLSATDVVRSFTITSVIPTPTTGG